MVWAAISTELKSSLVFMIRDPSAKKNGYSARSYIWALEEGLLPIYEEGQAFQQDNASIHTAKITKDWLDAHNIELILWPPHSPDLNPIKHVWKALKQKLYTIFPDTDSLRDNQADLAELKRRMQVA